MSAEEAIAACPAGRSVRSAPRRRGFTLIEILMVVAIAAALLAAASSLFSGGNFERVEAGVRLVRSDMDYARATSLANPANPVVIRIAADGSGYHLAFAGTPDTPIQGPRGPLVRTFGVGSAESARGCELTTVSGAQLVRFGPFGGVEDPVPTLQVTLSGTGERATLFLNPITGDPSVTYGNQ